jgi:hypothetical protein
MQKMRKLSIVLMVLMLLAMGSFAAAQDIPCGDLSEEDCSLLSGTTEAMGSVSSATFTIDMSITTTEDEEETTITISGDGSFSGAEGLLGDSMTAMMSDPASAADTSAMMQMFGVAIADLDAALNLNVDAGAGDEIVIELVLVDSIGYVNFDALGLAGMQLGEDLTLPEWGGVNLPELLETMGPQMGAMMGGGMPGGGMPGGGTTGGGLPEDFDPESFGQYFIITRLEDDAMDDGTAVAVFEMTVDFAGMMSDPALQEAMAESGEEITEAQMEAMMSMYENMAFALNVYVGLEDNYLYGFDLALSMDMSAMAATSGTRTSGNPGAVDVAFSLYLADFNAAPEITAPEGAEVATTDQLMSLMGMMMGGMGAPSR